VYKPGINIKRTSCRNGIELYIILRDAWSDRLFLNRTDERMDGRTDAPRLPRLQSHYADMIRDVIKDIPDVHRYIFSPFPFHVFTEAFAAMMVKARATCNKWGGINDNVTRNYKRMRLQDELKSTRCISKWFINLTSLFIRILWTLI